MSQLGEMGNSSLNYNTRLTIERRWSTNNKSIDDALIEDMTLNHYQWSSEKRASSRTTDKYEVDTLNSLRAKVDSLSYKLDSFNWNLIAIYFISCEICRVTGHYSAECQLRIL